MPPPTFGYWFPGPAALRSLMRQRACRIAAEPTRRRPPIRGSVGGRSGSLKVGQERARQIRSRASIRFRRAARLPARDGVLFQQADVPPTEAGSPPEQADVDLIEAAASPDQAGLPPVRAGLSPDQAASIYLQAAPSPEEAGLPPERAGSPPERADLEMTEAEASPGRAGLPPDRADASPDQAADDFPEAGSSPVQAERPPARAKAPPGQFSGRPDRLQFPRHRREGTPEYDPSVEDATGRSAAPLSPTLSRRRHHPHRSAGDLSSGGEPEGTGHHRHRRPERGQDDPGCHRRGFG
jgi:hypothetical protein